MEQLVKGYINLLSSPGNASAHFWEMEKRIKRDKKKHIRQGLHTKHYIFDGAYGILGELTAYFDDLLIKIRGRRRSCMGSRQWWYEIS